MIFKPYDRYRREKPPTVIDWMRPRKLGSQLIPRWRGRDSEKARQAFPEIWSPSSSTRTNDVSGFAMAASVLSRAARRTELRRSRRTEPPLDMLMTLQGVYEKSLGCRRALGERHGGRASGMGELDLSELD